VTLDFAEPALDGGASRRIDPAFRAHYLTIVRLCMRQLGDPNDAEDAAQETFRRALQQRGGVVGDPLPWLIAVARNVCIDELRRRRSGRTALERTAAAGSVAQTDSEVEDNPERVVVGRMFVHELLGRLTPAERRVVAGTVIDGQSGGEVAESLGVTASTTRVLLARAREKMRRYLNDGQVAMNGVLLLGWRASVRLRHRVLSRPVALQPRVELLFPALVMTALVSSTGGASLGGTVASDLTDGSAQARLSRLVDAGMSGGTSTAHDIAGMSSAGGGATANTASGASSRGGRPSGTSPVNLLFPTPDPSEVGVTDFEPSPDYTSDHSVLMIGDGNCPEGCTQLFRSTDGGATWTYVPTSGLAADHLLIPVANRSLQHFFSVGGGMLQVTDNGGGAFHNVMPLTGIASVAPSWLGQQLVESDVALSFMGGSAVPQVAAAFQPGDLAVSAPVLVPSTSGFTALQLVQNSLVGGDDTLLMCGGGICEARATVPLAGEVQLLASPDYAEDQTLVAVGGGVAVSRDGGQTFTLVSTKAVSQATMVRGPRGIRLIAVEAPQPNASRTVLAYSDDLGSTWVPAALDPGARVGATVRNPTVLRPGLLLAWAADAATPGHNVFVCSSDGTRWSTCTADRG
jgi:RNA polymerase sigma-70 factor (ECF subfamily)